MDGWPFSRRQAGSGKAPDYYREGLKLAGEEKYHEALTSFRLALKSQPNDSDIMQQMAVVYTHIGMPEEAIRLYEAAIRASDDAPAAHYGLAFILLKQGDAANARRHLNEFLKHPPGDERAAAHVEHARKTLERLETPGSGGGKAEAGE
jgi:tetratricopeptide (TPR) repeat protein